MISKKSLLSWLLVYTLLSACGSAVKDASQSSNYSLGGNITGLAGNGLVLRNGQETITVEKANDLSNSIPFRFSETLQNGSDYSVVVDKSPAHPMQTCEIKNGAGKIQNAAVMDISIVCTTQTFSISGNIVTIDQSGLSGALQGSGLKLQLNDIQPVLDIESGSTRFTFPDKVESGRPYSINIIANPINPNQVCAANNGIGEVDDAPVNNIGVVCSTRSFFIGGSVSGLEGNKLNVGDAHGGQISLTADGQFRLPNLVPMGAAFSLTLETSPLQSTPPNPALECLASPSTGNIAMSDVVVNVVCTRKKFKISGKVLGLSGEGLQLRNSNGETLDLLPGTPAGAEVSFAFTQPVESLAGYEVVVARNPNTKVSQMCIPRNSGVNTNRGTVADRDITNIIVDCTSNNFNVGGTISGLRGTVTLKNNATSEAFGTSGAFHFATPVASGAVYSVSVTDNPRYIANTGGGSPTSLSQTCTVTAGNGVVAVADVASVQVNCSPNKFKLGANVAGYTATGLMLRSGTGQSIAVSANGLINFPTSLDSGTVYSLEIAQQPSNGAQTCLVANGSGVIGDADVKVNVNCGYTIGGSVSGLATGTALSLALTYGTVTETLPVTQVGNFKFTSSLISNTSYNVSIKTMPANQLCTLSNAVGTVGTANVTTVAINCIGAVSVGGTLSGLATGQSITLQLAGQTKTLSADGAFTFDTPVNVGTKYDLIVLTSPVGEQCNLLNASGTVSVPIDNLAVNCSGVAFIAGNMGGKGNTDGLGSAARFYSPLGVVADAAGNVYVADQWNHTIRMIDSLGVVSTLAGAPGVMGSVDGTGSAARFAYPFSIAVDASRNLYVVENGNYRIRKLSLGTSGWVVTTIAGGGTGVGTDGPGLSATFNNPKGIAIDSKGVLYVADASNYTIRKIEFSSITPTNVSGWTVSTLAGTLGQFGNKDSTTADPSARFNLPHGVAVDGVGNVYVGDTFNHAIRKITPAGFVTTLAGSGAAGMVNATGLAAKFNEPGGVYVDNAQNVYVADTRNHVIRKIDAAANVTTFAGSAGVSGSSDSPTAMFYTPVDVAGASNGNLYVADYNNHTIRKIVGTTVSTLAGWASVAGSTNGVGGAAQFSSPQGISVDGTGNLLVADVLNHIIRKVTPQGSVTLLSGIAGSSGNSDTPDIRLNGPMGVVADVKSNSFYVADSYNHTIRKIDSTGKISTTIAGLAGAPGLVNGAGVSAQFNTPQGIAIDANGDLYVADTLNHVIRKITFGAQTVNVTTLAGNNKPAFADATSGINAAFNNPIGIAVDRIGNVYVADTNNHRIRQIAAAGANAVTTYAGNGVAGYVDGSGGVAQFVYPHGIAVAPEGTVYVVDVVNPLIRKIDTQRVVSTIAGAAGKKGFNPGPLPSTLGYSRGLAVSGTTLYFTTENGVAALFGRP